MNPTSRTSMAPPMSIARPLVVEPHWGEGSHLADDHRGDCLRVRLRGIGHRVEGEHQQRSAADVHPERLETRRWIPERVVAADAGVRAALTETALDVAQR